MAVSFDTSNMNSIQDGGSLTWVSTLSASANFVLIFVGWLETTPSANGMVLDSIKINGSDCTFGSQISGGSNLDTWYMNSPPTGAITILVTWLDSVTGLPSVDGAVSAVGGNMSFIGTVTGYQTNITRSNRGEQYGVIDHRQSPGSHSVAVTSTAGTSTNNMIADCVQCLTTSASDPTWTVDPFLGQTERWNSGVNGASGQKLRDAASTKPSANASIPMRWAQTPLFSQWVQSVVKVA